MYRSASDREQGRAGVQTSARPFSHARLYTKLDAALAAGIVLVVADEPLGKSTLIREYLGDRAIPCRRFVAAAENATILEFFRAFAATFADDRPAMGRSYGAAAGAIENGNLEAGLRWACDHLRGVRATVVLDDLHDAVADDRCVAFLSAVIDATDGLRWVLGLREASAFPIPGWLASGRAGLPIEEADLRFRAADVAAAFATAGRPLDDAAVGALTERTRGWALPLERALASGDLDASAAPADVYRSVVADAMAALDHDERIVVIELAAMRHFDDEALSALECDRAFAETLVALRILVAVDARGFAIHEALRALLLARLDDTDAETRMRCLDRAASALACAGRWSDATALRIRAGDEDGVARALADRGFRALDGGEIATVARALIAVSETALRRHPIALAVKGALASVDGNLDVAEAWFRIAVEIALGAERRRIVIRYGMDLVRRNRDDAIALLEAETNDTTTSAADMDAPLWALLGTAYVQAHRNDEGRSAARRALDRLPGVRDSDVRARVLHQASYVALAAGDYAAAKSLAGRALARADDSFLFDVSARALSVLFNVAMLHDGDVPAARSALMRLEEAGRKSGISGLRVYALLNAYAIEADAGNLDALDRLDGELNAMQVMLTPTVVEALLPAQALRAAWRGDFAHAHELLANTAEKIDDADRAVYRWAEIALYAAAAGRERDASDAVRRYRSESVMLDESHELPLRGGAYVVLASLLVGRRDDADAVLSSVRKHALTATRRMRALVDAVEALYATSSGGARAVLALGERLDALTDHDLGGVGRLIAQLGYEVTEPERRAAATSRSAAS